MKSVLKKITLQCITKDELFWSYGKLKVQDMGLDPRKEFYYQVDKMSLFDVKTFFNTYIRYKNYNLLVVGKKKS